MKGKRSFSEETLRWVRSMPIMETLDRLGVLWKQDRDFQPEKDAQTVRLNVSAGNCTFELVVTGPKWYDMRAEKGGGGGIDLTMHVLGVDFVAAVKRLLATKGVLFASGGSG